MPEAEAATESATAAVDGRTLLWRGGRLVTMVGALATLFLVYEFVLTGLVSDRMQPGLLTAFRHQIITTTLGSASSVSAEGAPVALLSIPRINLNQVVVEGTTPEDLKGGPGHLRRAPLPGEFGNAIVAARRTTYGGPFRQLDSLRRGDDIRATTGQGSFRYIVNDVRPVRPGEPDPVAPSGDSRLTLITSDPPFVASGRMTVVARLEGAPVDVARRPQAPIASSDLGLAGDPLGLGLALVWGQLLMVAIWLTLRLRGRWPGSVTYMLAAPVILGLMLLMFTGLDRVLPGTL